MSVFCGSNLEAIIYDLIELDKRISALEKQKTEETKMEKPIFKNVEQLKIFLHTIFDHQTHRIKEQDNSICEYIIDAVKQNGYIEKSSLEIARENFKRWANNANFENHVLPAEPCELIDELEKEITRLQNK